MNFTTFLRLSLVTAAVGIAIVYLIGMFVQLGDSRRLIVCSIALFFGLNLITYVLGQRASYSNRNGSFLSVVVINTLLKLMLSFAFMFYYVRTFAPNDKMFIIPFLVFYLVFMIMETYFLTQQARKSKVS